MKEVRLAENTWGRFWYRGTLSGLLVGLYFALCTNCGAAGLSQPGVGRACKDIADGKYPGLVIESATRITSSGAFSPRPGAVAGAIGPPFCRIIAVAHPTADSNIRLELWVPEGKAWNGKFEQMGNGGFAGSIEYDGMYHPLARGYAVAATDDGHDTADDTDASWALGHPEKVKDFGWRAVKVTTDAAKQLLESLTGRRPERSYFVGCSDGGREALMTAQRFPRDFDGIVAGAPGYAWTDLMSFAGRMSQSLNAPAGALSPAKLPMLQRAALAACADGGGYIKNPLACHFDPGTLACKGHSSSGCLTGGEIKSLQLIYGGVHEPLPGRSLPGFEPGAEAAVNSWGFWIVPGANGQVRPYLERMSKNFYAYMVRGEPAFDLNVLSTADVDRARREIGPILNAMDADLSDFRTHGGKLIQYHGWNDPAIPPHYSLDYHARVVAKLGPSSDFYRLFMIPGMLHCSGGAGPGDVDWQTLIENWVERGSAPTTVSATSDADYNSQEIAAVPDAGNR
jgi:pimeloyl-ACP methyl ester carboxylesterase